MNQIQDLCTTFFQSFQSSYFERKRYCLFNFNWRYSIFDSPFGRMKKKKKLYGPFLRIRFNCLKAIEQLRGYWLLFTTKFPEIPAPHLIDLGRMTRWMRHDTQWFRTWDPWIGKSTALTTLPLLHRYEHKRQMILEERFLLLIILINIS